VAFQVSEGDGLPQQICHKCLRQVNKWYKFRELCKNADAFLRQYISKTQQNQVSLSIGYISILSCSGFISCENSVWKTYIKFCRAIQSWFSLVHFKDHFMEGPKLSLLYLLSPLTASDEILYMALVITYKFQSLL